MPLPDNEKVESFLEMIEIQQIANSGSNFLDSVRITSKPALHRFCRSFIRYLGRLDPGYSQHLGLTTIELSKVNLTDIDEKFFLTFEAFAG